MILMKAKVKIENVTFISNPRVLSVYLELAMIRIYKSLILSPNKLLLGHNLLQQLSAIKKYSCNSVLIVVKTGMSNCKLMDSRLKRKNLIITLLISFIYLLSFGQDTYFYYFTSIQRKNKWTQIIINSLKHRHSDKEIKLVEQKKISH